MGATRRRYPREFKLDAVRRVVEDGQPHTHVAETREEARRDLFDYIEVFYNRRRRHSHIGRISPAEFERRMKDS